MLTTDYYRWLLVLHRCSCYSLPVCCTQLDHTHGDVVQRTTCFRKNRMVLHSVVGLTSDSTQLAKLTVTQLQVINSVVEFDSTVGLTTATLRWLEWPKFTFRNFSLCRTRLLVWCLECAKVKTSPQFLKINIGYLLVSDQSSRRPWWSGSVFMVSLQPISVISAYPLLPSPVVSICALQRLALYWFHAPGLQLDNEVS